MILFDPKNPIYDSAKQLISFGNESKKAGYFFTSSDSYSTDFNLQKVNIK